MKEQLTNEDFCRASKAINCSVAAIKAVEDTESRGKAFYSDGFPVILFERHIFKKYTKGRYSAKYPHLSGPAGNYGPAGQNQRNKFNEAFGLDPEAAMMACSWGKFQIMGFNHKACGYDTVGEFVDAMKESAGKQLDAFVSFLKANNIDRYLRTLNWAEFARRYNGPAYKKNKYDTKMATAYKRFLKEDLDCQDLDLSEVTETFDITDNPKSEPTTDVAKVVEDIKGASKDVENVNVNLNTPSNVEQDKPIEVPKEEPKETSGWGTWVANVRAQIGAAGLSIPAIGGLTFFTNPTFWYIALGVLVFAAIVSLAVYLYSMNLKSKEKIAREQMASAENLKKMEIYSDPTKYNVVLK